MKFLAALIFIFLLVGTISPSLLFMSTGMDTAHGVEHCLFMTHTEALCPMSVIDHIGAWKSAFLALPAALLVLLIGAAVGITHFPFVGTFLYWRPLVYVRQLRERTYSFSYRSLQELFSNGILHPKLF